MSVTTEQQIPTGTWTVDPVHSSAEFSVKHMVVATYRSRFDRFDASLVIGEDGAAVLTGSVDAASIVAKDENLAGHLASPDFFDVASHPHITFRSTSIRIEGGEAVIAGELTIKGHTQAVETRSPIVGPHVDIAGNEKVGLTLAAAVDRTEFGLDWNAPLPKGGFALGDEVKLHIELELVKAA